MPIHFGARIHALTHNVFRASEIREVRELYNAVATDFRAVDIDTEDGRFKLVSILVCHVCEQIDVEFASPLFDAIETLIRRLVDHDKIWMLPEIDWSTDREVSEWWELRAELQRQKDFLAEHDDTFHLIASMLVALLRPVAATASKSAPASAFDLRVQTSLLNRVSSLPEALDGILNAVAAPDVMAAGLFPSLHDRLEQNLITASGGNPTDPRTFGKSMQWPTRSNIQDPEKLTKTYLGRTPFVEFLATQQDVIIPTATRFEHAHMVAGSGHGKSQTLQYLIAQDLPAVAAGKRSVVVIDSQGDLIKNISRLAEFAPGGTLADRLVIIDPTDVAYPVSLNLFDVGQDRMAGYEALERERLTNSILELYDFVLGSLLDAAMTQKQSVIFRYVTRLMLHIDNATIHTLRELMEEGSEEVFADDIAKLSGTARTFFESEFGDREFKQTRKQVLRRLWGILENQTFERMFSHPQSKLDLFSEMNAGKVILINTAKDLLKEQGTQVFGRFFIAMIAQAAQERATLPASERMPTFVYVDEAADYFDRNIGVILSQARKYNVGMVLAHQFLGQLEPKLQEAFSANTSIKCAGGVSTRDAKALAPMLYCQPELIERQPKGSFATFVRGVTKSALPLSLPFGHMERMTKMSLEQAINVRDLMREHYAVHISELPQANQPSPGTTDEEPVELGEDAAPDTPSIDIEPSDQW